MALRFPIPASMLGLSANLYTSVLFPVGAGSLIGLVTKTSVSSWYPTLKKPKCNPPRWAFPVAWTYLYASMGYSSYLLARLSASTHSIQVFENTNLALRLYYIQLALNFVWTPIFFGLKKPGLALIDIISLTSTVLWMTNVTRKVHTKAAYLFLPYCAWLSYATYLNGCIWYLNGGKKKLRSLKETILGPLSTNKRSD